jgi:phospholipid/cholesterol/gamma-HCH transport system permease protein
LSDPLGRVVSEAAEMGSFAGRTVIRIPGSLRYSAEILRQVGILVAGSGLVICFMMFVIGTMCGTEAIYTLRGYGATAYAGSFTYLCGTREMAPYMLCYMLAAKVGTGWAAELGSARISEEIDALEVQGIDPIKFLVTTKLVAAWLFIPFVFLIGLSLTDLGSYFVIIVQLKALSPGGWGLVQWGLQSPTVIVEVVVKACFMGTVVVIAALFYGYRASGGPVGVGQATARSMIFNMVVVNITATMMTMLFWGVSAKLPIGG